MRPCRCSGTMASVHRVCLERWLNLATKDKCELCGHRYSLSYTSRPFWEVICWECSGVAGQVRERQGICIYIERRTKAEGEGVIDRKKGGKVKRNGGTGKDEEL